jgi:ankyrin repeat protein
MQIYIHCGNCRTALTTQRPSLENGANPNTEISHYCTALLLASANGNLKMVELLVKNGADINYSAWNRIEEFGKSKEWFKVVKWK